MAAKTTATEDPAHAAQHCLKQNPYRLIVYSRTDGNGTPLFLVAGSAAREAGADKALREAHKLHGGECFYCRQKISDAELTIDHVEPEVLGGQSHLQNLVLTHKRCNANKGHKIIEAYHPDAGREWLNALLLQVQDRINRL